MQKDKLYNRLNEYDRTECHSLFRMLLEAEIQEYREGNDSVKATEVFRNQGAIACLKKLLKFTAPRSVEEKQVYDGGFGN